MPPRMRRPVQREDRPAPEEAAPYANYGTPISNTIGNDAIWQAWNRGWTWPTTGTAATITYATADQVWRAWNSTGTGAITPSVYAPTTRREAMEEEVAYRERVEQRYREQQERGRAEAEARVEERHRKFRTAEALLLEWLDEEQTRSYQTDRYFLVRGSEGRLYQIHCNSSCSGNIVLLAEGEDGFGTPTSTVCIHPSGLPLPDAWLAQKLMIETDEPEFRRIGNFSGVYGMPRVRLPREDDVIMEITFTDEETDEIMAGVRSDSVPPGTEGIIPHGTLAGYVDFGCRCLYCSIVAPPVEPVQVGDQQFYRYTMSV